MGKNKAAQPNWGCKGPDVDPRFKLLVKLDYTYLDIHMSKNNLVSVKASPNGAIHRQRARQCWAPGVAHQVTALHMSSLDLSLIPE